MKQAIIGLLLGMLLFTTTGCGPIVSGVRILKADIALSEAQTAGALRVHLRIHRGEGHR